MPASLTISEKMTLRPARHDWPRILLRSCRLLEAAPPGKAVTPLLAGLGVSVGEIQRQFRSHLGVTPKGYIQALRLARLTRTINSESSALAATLGAGFESSTRGYAVTRSSLGVPPGRLRRSLHPRLLDRTL